MRGGEASMRNVRLRPIHAISGREYGRVAPALKAARQLVVAEVLEMAAANIVELGRVDLAHYIQIRDQTGAIVGEIRFDGVVAFKRHREPISL